MAKRSTGIYQTVNGQQVELNARQVKSFIMKVNGWTSEQYRKQYDIFKNKVRAYEGYQRAKGQKVQTQSVAGLLYKEARAKKREGTNYKPSIKMQRIRSFTSISSGKALQKALKSKRYLKAREETYEQGTLKQFKGLIDANPQAKQIYDAISDPVKREQALTDYANALGLKINEAEEVQAESAIPFGETMGSSDAIDFDINDYL